MQRLKAALSRQQAAADKDTDQDTDKDKDIAESVHDGAIPDTEVERLSKLIEALGPPRDQLLAVIEAAGISGSVSFTARCYSVLLVFGGSVLSLNTPLMLSRPRPHPRPPPGPLFLGIMACWWCVVVRCGGGVMQAD